MNRSRWRYDHEGRWTLESERGDGHLRYHIDVDEDGLFTIAESDAQLIAGETEREFLSLALAKQFCEAVEAQAMAPSSFAGDRA